MAEMSTTNAARRPLRLLHVITPSRVSGAERVAVDLCLGLRARGHEVVLATKIANPFVPFAREHGLECLELNIAGKGNLAAPLNIGRVARQRRLDLIDTHLSTASEWGSIVGRCLRIPVVSHVQALNTKTCYVLADRIICCSRAVKEHLCRQGLPAGRIEVVFNSVDLDRFSPKVPKEEARRSLGIDAEAFLVGVTAHLSEKKGHGYLLQAAARLVGDFPQLQLVFVGEGPDRERLESLAAELGIRDHLTLAGYQPDVVPFLTAMDVLALPSVAKEGLPTTLIEGGAMGLPTIATDVGGANEIIDEGATGFIIPPGDVGSLAATLATLMRDRHLQQSMGQAAQRKVRSTFSLKNTVRNVERVYYSLLRQKGRCPLASPRS